MSKWCNSYWNSAVDSSICVPYDYTARSGNAPSNINGSRIADFFSIMISVLLRWQGSFPFAISVAWDGEVFLIMCYLVSSKASLLLLVSEPPHSTLLSLWVVMGIILILHANTVVQHFVWAHAKKCQCSLHGELLLSSLCPHHQGFLKSFGTSWSAFRLHSFCSL